MSMSLDTIRSTLETLARTTRSMETFNGATGSVFPMLDSGSYRVVFDAGDYVIKLRKPEGTWSKDMMHNGNCIERRNWMNLPSEMQFFVLEPIYMVLPNGHDAIVMRKVNVTHTAKSGRWWLSWTPAMNMQHRFILNTFIDSHERNIGWDVTTERVWLIDYNHGANLECRDNERSSDAKNIIKQYSSSRSYRKAA